MSTTFVCAGQFSAESMLCSRQDTDALLLLQLENSTLFSVVTSGAACDVDCVNIAWENQDNVDFHSENSDGGGDIPRQGTCAENISGYKTASSETPQTSPVFELLSSTEQAGDTTASVPTKLVHPEKDPSDAGTSSKQMPKVAIAAGVAGALVFLITIVAAAAFVVFRRRKRRTRENSRLSSISPHPGATEDNGEISVSDKHKIIEDNVSEKSSGGTIELENAVYWNESSRDGQGSHYVNFRDLHAILGSQSDKNAEELASDSVYGNSSEFSAKLKAADDKTTPAGSRESNRDYGRPESVYCNWGDLVTSANAWDCEYVAVDELPQLRKNPDKLDATSENRRLPSMSHAKTAQGAEETKSSVTVSQVKFVEDIVPLQGVHREVNRSGEVRSSLPESSKKKGVQRKTQSAYTHLSIGQDGAPYILGDSLNGLYNTASGEFETFLEQKRKSEADRRQGNASGSENRQSSSPNNEDVHAAAKDQATLPNLPEDDSSSEPEPALYFDLEDTDSLVEEDYYNNDVVCEVHHN
ncbi:hypothetical protein ElyMa_000115800 [Elysia marginata]|uniref:Uncharacterized protein n=1 Tax=Elysia marginata TaxID=1093978 RepID=A0AAV4ELK7_9GAST|nr:hypothetical protein ElyMa_000115800 [Elysia marginata]